ncbi:type VII secretion protein EccB [Micromonospora sp. PLK6-60]|uniref:type VII secretion protein EccB n=1 Tax=Micromonospora sp. PLK6-60 TaxID=2873383 RepID=UPI001CA6D431|nr:type VII secretion protein EccB [Micromonospora sp. PLK6-60]MBY8871728.1 type VII secretion protein EccB [Micromonospora sp. PLK6-60]
MRTRRDQVQAYRFVTRRIVSALLSGDPETNNLPMRRLGMAVFGSVIAAAVVLGGVGAYGQLTSNAAPLEPDTLVIERETGATYVFVEGRLHPTLNYASARLILNEPDPEVRTMSRASIEDRPRGRAVGIVGAPDDLPDRKALVGLPWSVCDVPDPNDQRRTTTQLVIDRPLPGGTPLTDRAMLVTARGERYLLTGNARLRVTDGDASIAALGMTGSTTLEVGEQLLNAVPAGPALRAPRIEGDGERSGLVVGDGPAEIGQVFRAAGRHYVLTREGLVSIGDVTALLLLGGGGRITDIPPDRVGQMLVRKPLEADGMPQRMPTTQPARTGETVICASYGPGPAGGPPTTTVTAFDRPPAELTATVTADSRAVRQSWRDAVRTADQVTLPGGKGVLVRGAAGSGEGGDQAGATVYLISSQGVRYPLGAGAVEALGYAGVEPLAVPASLLALVPTGPALSREGAQTYFEPAGRRDAGDGGASPTPAPSTSPSGAGQ